MKVLVLNGSPKRAKSDTMHLTNAFLKGFSEVTPCEVTVLHTVDCNVKYCCGSLACMRNGGKCVFDDDMTEILQQMAQCDLLVFSFPLYCYGMPASLKAVLDRVLPLSALTMVKDGERYRHTMQREIAPKRYLMICGCGFPNSKGNFEGAVAQFKLNFPHDATEICVSESPMFNEPTARPVTEPFLKLMESAGAEYAQNGALSEETMKKLSTPMIPEEVYASIVNGQM